jgi:hypothetical protein
MNFLFSNILSFFRDSGFIDFVSRIRSTGNRGFELLVPVSLVELSPSHILFILISFLIFVLSYSNFWMVGADKFHAFLSAFRHFLRAHSFTTTFFPCYREGEIHRHFETFHYHEVCSTTTTTTTSEVDYQLCSCSQFISETVCHNFMASPIKETHIYYDENMNIVKHTESEIN